MQLTMRAYQNEDDYWRIRVFLREVFLLNERREVSWHVARFDYWRWHGVENLTRPAGGSHLYLGDAGGANRRRAKPGRQKSSVSANPS